jgi:hypothetical protein
MRDYSRIVPAFWTSRTGKELRANRDARILATYFISSPAANMIGLYYLAIPTILHETGFTRPEFDAALAWLSDPSRGFAFYDEAAEYVWVPEMAAIQIGVELKEKDLQVRGIARELRRFEGHRFHQEFVARYAASFQLQATQRREPQRAAAGPKTGRPFEGPSKGVQTPFEGGAPPPSKPGSGSGAGTRAGGDPEAPPIFSEPETPKRAPPARAPALAWETSAAPEGASPPAAQNVAEGTRRSRGGALTPPVDAQGLIHALRVLNERHRPSDGFWDKGSFAEKEAGEIFEDATPEQRAEMAPKLLERAKAFVLAGGGDVRAFRRYLSETGPGGQPRRVSGAQKRVNELPYFD